MYMHLLFLNRSRKENTISLGSLLTFYYLKGTVFTCSESGENHVRSWSGHFIQEIVTLSIDKMDIAKSDYNKTNILNKSEKPH